MNNSLLVDSSVIEEIKKKSKEFMEFNENDERACPNLQGKIKAVLRGKFMTLSDLIKKLEKSYTTILTTHTGALEKKKKKANTYKRIRNQEIVKFRAEINQLEKKS